MKELTLINKERPSWLRPGTIEDNSGHRALTLKAYNARYLHVSLSEGANLDNPRKTWSSKETMTDLSREEVEQLYDFLGKFLQEPI